MHAHQCCRQSPVMCTHVCRCASRRRPLYEDMGAPQYLERVRIHQGAEALCSAKPRWAEQLHRLMSSYVAQAGRAVWLVSFFARWLRFDM